MTVQPGPAAGLRPLVGDGSMVPCVDGHDRPYIGLDAAASTSALPVVARAVEDFLPWYSSVHRGAGYKSQRSTRAYEAARAAALGFAGRSPGGSDVAIICRNATEAINHLAYRLRLAADDVVVTTVVEHHANLLPWARLCRRRFVECGPDGTFSVDEVAAALDARPRPRLLAVTGATGVPHALVAARLSAEHGIGVRHGCFCAHPYLVRLLGLGPDQIARHWHNVRHGDHRDMPGAIRASAGLSTSIADIDRLVGAVADIASDRPAPVGYHQEARTGDFHPEDGTAGPGGDRALGASCARG